MDLINRTRQFSFYLMCFLVLLLSGYSASYFIPGMPFSFRPDVYPQSNLTPYLLLHIVGGICAALAGPFQFWQRFRLKSPKRHRAIGVAYVASVLLAASSALVIATVAQGGLTTQFGFSMLAICWLTTTGMAIYKIYQGDKLSHRVWMLRSYALTLAFVMLRLWLAGLTALGLPFIEVYQSVAWLCWVPNILFVQIWIAKIQTTGA